MSLSLPRRVPLLLLKDDVLLPGTSLRVPVKNPVNINMVKSRLLNRHSLSSTVIGVVPYTTDTRNGVHSVGVAAVVVQVTGTNWPEPHYTLLLTGICRFRIDEILQETPYLVASVTQLGKLPGSSDEDVCPAELVDVAETMRKHASELIDLLDVSIPIVSKLKKMLTSVPNEHLPDLCANLVKASFSEKLQILDAVDLEERFRKTLPLLDRQLEALKLVQKSRKQSGIELENNRKALLLKKELRRPQTFSESHEETDDLTDLMNRLYAAEMPDEVVAVAIKEYDRLKKMPSHSPEHPMLRSYLELLAELPWSNVTQDNLDIVEARKCLDADHYGMEKLKQRVIEYMAVRRLKNSLKGPILCFVGPPGVGKTSLGRSIAHSIGRQFHRLSLGGISDQSDIRGHRRTYIGSMPGRIIQAIKAAGTKNPVILLDEIDKISSSIRGDPSAALLEVLDAEQNYTFTDHYLNVPFDLSQVMFIATANSTVGIPSPLLDRMELISVPGYTRDEKVEIAIRHLLPKMLREHGLEAENIKMSPDTLQSLILQYTREAGVRELERHLAALCRSIAVRVAEMASAKGATVVAEEVRPNGESVLGITIDTKMIEDVLGPPKFYPETSERLKVPGVAVGLAWMPHGGEIMFVEASKMPGSGDIVLTGMLGQVMEESAKLALTWLRSNSEKLSIESSTLDLTKTDIHIHFPAGAINKDGPSAGITVAVALVSLFTNRCVRSDTAMTGEITLRGTVLPVGGIKSKILAAHRAGIPRVLLPKRNGKDLFEIPTNVKDEISFVFVENLDDVIMNAFEESPLKTTTTTTMSQSSLMTSKL